MGVRLALVGVNECVYCSYDLYVSAANYAGIGSVCSIESILCK